MSIPEDQAFVFDSHDYSGQGAFDQWRDEVAATHDATDDSTPYNPFNLNYRIFQAGPVMVSSATFTAQTFVREPRHFRRDHLDHYGLYAQGIGTRKARIGDSVEFLRQHDLQIFDLAQEETSSAADGQCGTLYLPRDLVDEVIPDFSSLHGRVLRNESGKLLAQHILAMGTYLHHVPAEGIAGFAEATVQFALTTIERSTAKSEEQQQYNVQLLNRIKQYLESHLLDENLAPEYICAEFGISRATLYRLFEPHGGVARFIKTRRLQRVRTQLVAASRTGPLQPIIEAHGFQSESHFRRVFGEHFGYPPGEIRAAEKFAAADSRPALSSLFHALRAPSRIEDSSVQ